MLILFLRHCEYINHEYALANIAIVGQESSGDTPISDIVGHMILPGLAF